VLLRGRIVAVAALLRRSIGLLRVLRISLRRAVVLGRTLLVILLRRHFELCLELLVCVSSSLRIAIEDDKNAVRKR
jgi:hypothetical protein